LLVTDFILIKQKCTGATFDLDAESGVEYTERMVDAGLMPWMCLNILIHSHPGNCPNPSFIDEQNFQKAFAHPDWAIMLIVAKDNSTYCRLKINVGPGITKLLKVEVDFSQEFTASNHTAWDEEYKTNVKIASLELAFKKKDIPMIEGNDFRGHDHYNNYCDFEDIDCYRDNSGNVIFWDEDGVWYCYNPMTDQWSKEDLNINCPTEPWAAKVIAWAREYPMTERDLLTYDIEEDL